MQISQNLKLKQSQSLVMTPQLQQAIKLLQLNNLDLTNFNLFNKFIRKIKPQIVFHLAGQPLVFNSYLNPIRTFEINSNGSFAVPKK